MSFLEVFFCSLQLRQRFVRKKKRRGQKVEKANKAMTHQSMLALGQIKSALTSKHDDCTFGLASGSREN